MVTGMGAVGGFGWGIPALRAAMREGRSTIRPFARYRPWGPALVAAMVPGEEGVDPEGGEEERVADRASRWAVAAAREALGSAGAGPGPRLALVLGTNLEDRHVPVIDLARRVGEAVGAAGPRWVVSVACASSLAVFAHARDLLARGDADRVLVGGVDVLTERLHAGFAAVGALAPGAVHPFDVRVGTALGEGAGFVVLERGEAPEPRALAWLLGVGFAGDAYHLTQPAPGGQGVRDALRRAVAEAGVVPGYVNAHGTGTEANDAPEARGIAAAVGAEVPVSSSKGLLGHAQGAAGILEVLVTLLALDAGELPPTWGLVEPRPGAPADPVPRGRPGRPRAWASVNSAFGGANVAAVFGESASATARPGPARLVAVAAVSAGEEGLAAEGAWPGPLPEGVVARLRRYDVSRADAASRGLLAVTLEVLDRAGVLGSRAERVATGIVLGIPAIPREAQQELLDSVERGGLGRLHAGAFARALLVAPAGFVSRELGLRGPVDTLSAGRAGVLLALARAVAGPGGPLVAAGTVDEGGWTGAVAALVERGMGGVEVDGVAVEGAGGLDRAVARVGGGPVFGPRGCHPLADGYALARAWRALGAGEAERVVVAAEEPGALAVAVALHRRPV